MRTIGFTNSDLTLRRHIIAYWVTTALVVSELALGGVWDVLRECPGFANSSRVWGTHTHNSRSLWADGRQPFPNPIR